MYVDDHRSKKFIPTLVVFGNTAILVNPPLFHPPIPGLDSVLAQGHFCSIFPSFHILSVPSAVKDAFHP